MAPLRTCSSVLALAAVLALAGCGDNVTQVDTHKPYDAGDASGLSCVPNLDGRIDANELAPALDVAVKYLVSPSGKERPIDVAGLLKGGTLTWDWSIDYADDQRISVTASALAGKWYAASFPSGQFTVPFDAAGTLEGIYRHDSTALWLLGIASVKADAPEGKTLLVYTDPVALFRFPLTVGAKWVETGTIVNGTFKGLVYAGKDVYEISDDATGKLVLHDVTLEQAHRVRQKVTVSPSAGAVTVRHQVSFVSECVGEIARATSRNNETNADFTVTSELRRWGL